MTPRHFLAAGATAVVLLSSLWLGKPEKFPDPKRAVCATKAEALVALDLMKEWGTWLTGIQTGAIAGLALIVKRRTRAATYAIVAIVLFGASIVADTALLGNLPRMAVRLSSPDHACDKCKPCSQTLDREHLDRRYDVYEMTVSETSGLRLGFAYMLSHWYFIFGVIAFGATFVVELTSPPADAEANKNAELENGV